MSTKFDPSPAQPDSSTVAGGWFEYPVRAHPHHTDYAGIVWHGTYIAWMEEARVEYLRSRGYDFATVVAMGCDMPVVDLSLRYHRVVKMGAPAVVHLRLAKLEGVRIHWDYRIQSPDAQTLHVTANVTLVTVDRATGKIMRRPPADVQTMLLALKGDRRNP